MRRLPAPAPALAIALLLGLAACATGSSAPGIDLVQVIGDDNADGVLNPGETASLQVQLFNPGSDLSGVRVALTTDSPFLTIDPGDAYCGSLNAGGTVSCTSVGVSVAESALPGAPAIVLAHVTSDSSSWTLGFEVPIQLTAAEPAVHEVVVIGDSNGDGVLNPGETGMLKITLVNGGTSELNGVRVELGSKTAGVELDAETDAWCGAVAPGKTVACQSIGVAVAPSVAAGSQALFSLVVTDDLGASWDLGFGVDVRSTAAEPVVVRAEVREDSNGDGVLNPGESAALRITLGNTGSSELNTVKYTLASDSPSVSVVDPGQTHCGSISAGKQTACSSDALLVAQDAAPGTVVGFGLFVVDDVGTSWDLSLPVPVLAQAGFPEIEEVEASLAIDTTSDVEITLKNGGTSRLLEPRVALETSAGGVTIQTPSPAWCKSDLDPGEVTSCSAISVQVDSAKPPVAFTVVVTDELGSSWSLPLDLPLD